MSAEGKNLELMAKDESCCWSSEVLFISLESEHVQGGESEEQFKTKHRRKLAKIALAT